MSLDTLEQLLFRWNEKPNWPTGTEDSVLDRVYQILREAHRTHARLWHGDLQPLLRHCLLRASAQAGVTERLRVPAADSGWPDQASWASHGVTAIEAGDAAYLLEARQWMPDWLDGGNRGVFADAFSERTVRPDWRCAVDPFIGDATGFSHYSCPGQREAVRAAFLMPPGDTLMVNLPTGSGKSLVGQAPALVHRDAGHLTLFVVPTVALAIDQERAMQALFTRGQPGTPKPLAWYGGLPEDQRAGIRQRLRQGTQRILFTSPEALTTSLLRVVSEVAEAGMLDYLVIDEAHLITQWGDEFRPTFQTLAGLRNNLLRLAPAGRRFRTLLLTATYTRETVE